MNDVITFFDRPNTVMIPFSSGSDVNDVCEFVETLKVVVEMKKVALVYKKASDKSSTTAVSSDTLDIWWIFHDGGLLLLLPFLLKKNKAWRRKKLRILTIARVYDNSILLEQELRLLVNEKLRIEAEIVVVEWWCNDNAGGGGGDGLGFRDEEHQHEFALKDFEQTMTRSEGENLLLRNIKICSSPHGKVTSSHEEKRESYKHLNHLMKRHSSLASFIFMNLPKLPKSSSSSKEYQNYVECIETLTQGLPATLLIKGTGKEVISSYF